MSIPDARLAHEPKLLFEDLLEQPTVLNLLIGHVSAHCRPREKCL